MPLLKPREYTIADIYNLPDGERAELIDGQIYYMAPPKRIHQEISQELSRCIGNYIHGKEGTCKVYAAPFAVFLSDDDKNYVEPDISVICDFTKLNDRGCIGAPDWIIEITSPSTQKMDYGIKLFKYWAAGVREYWVVNPMQKMVLVYDLENNGDISGLYPFDADIPVCIYPGFSINISQLLL